MPGYANWQTLYFDEYRQLKEEGYMVGDAGKPEAAEFLPFPAEVRGEVQKSEISEAQWEQAYWNLWKVRGNGLRPDWPYIEPDGLDDIINCAAPVPPLEKLSQEEYADRIKGAWFGRCAGVVLGKPLEMSWDRKQIQKYLESVCAYPLADWVPERSDTLDITLRRDCVPSTRGHVRYAQPDDDIHYTIKSLLLVEQKGLQFSLYDVGRCMMDNVPIFWVWGSSHQLYHHMVRLANDPRLHEELPNLRYHLNPWREWIDGQLKGDFWGYITPGDPREGARYIHRHASLSLTQNGIYGGMFVSGCLSAALSRNPTVESIIAGGLSVIPEKSRLAEAVRNVQRWYSESRDWIVTCDKINERYGHMHFADQINNMAMVVLSLLHGNLDYHRTITTAVMAGIDVDCNGGTAGSICGAAIGYDALPQRWIAPLNDTVRTVVAGFGYGTITDLVQRTIAVHNKHFGTL